jgi:flagellar basal body-associated protein FliL
MNHPEASMQHPSERRILYFYLTCIALFVALFLLGIYHVSARLSGATATFRTGSGPTDEWAYIELPRVTTTMGGGNMMQVKIDVALELDPRHVGPIEGYVPKIMDSLNTLFLKVDIEKLDQPKYMFLLHKDMLWRLNNLGMPFNVHDVMIKQLIIQ